MMTNEIEKRSKRETAAGEEVAVFEFDIDQTGMGHVNLNGHRLPRVRGVTLRAEAGTATIVTVEFIAAEVRGLAAVDITHMGQEWSQYAFPKEPAQ